MPLNHLFSEAKIGSLTLKNKVILPAMVTLYPDKGGLVSEKMVAYHVARAKGGCGMNIVEIAAVHPTSKAPRNLSIYDDSFIPGLSRLASAIKKAGGRAAIQIWHAGRQTYSRWTDRPLIAPSPIPCPMCKGMPVEMTKEIIEVVLQPGAQVSEKEIMAFCKQKLAAYKVPKLVEFRKSLPKSAVGKLLRKILREEEIAKTAAQRK